MHDPVGPRAEPLTLDEYGRELGHLRAAAGSPSYAEIAERIARRRQSAGMPEGRARIARSTVYDVFRPGRRRLDLALVREILTVLDLPPAEVDRWCERGRRATPAPLPPAEPPAEPPPDAAPPAGSPPGPERPVPAARRWRPRTIAVFLLACFAANLLGRAVVDLLDLPLHLDMVGTASAAVVLGPWWGALVAVLTNGFGALLSGPSSLPFALVNLTGALVWGYGVHRFGMGRTMLRFLALNLLAGTACTVVAAPILLLLYDGGGVRPGLETVTDTVYALTHVLALSVFVSNLLLSLADKTISGFVALAVAEAGAADRRAPLPLPPGPLRPDAEPAGRSDDAAGASPATGRGSST